MSCRNSSENRLFDLTGYSYVRVLYPDVVEPLGHLTEPYGRSDKGDLAQQLLETLISASGMSDLLEGCDRIQGAKGDPPEPLYPPPDRPDDRSFRAFMQCNVTALLDDTVLTGRGQADGHSHYNFELPSCKAWFIVSRLNLIHAKLNFTTLARTAWC